MRRQKIGDKQTKTEHQRKKTGVGRDQGKQEGGEAGAGRQGQEDRE